jgi:hypothetical protein
VTFDELTAGLIWPKLLRAFSMSLHPSRVLAGTLLVLAAWLVTWGVTGLAPDAGLKSPLTILSERQQAGVDALASGAIHASPLQAVAAWYALHIGLWRAAIQESPIVSIVLLLLLAPIIGVCGGAISRSVAVDTAASLAIGFRESLAFSLRRWLAFTFAVLIPLIFVAMLCVLLLAIGAATLFAKGVDVVGAVLFGPMLIVGILISLLLVGFAAGSSMLIPAVSAECTDAADAVQRVYAYMLGRPGRLLLYAGLLILIGVVAFMFVTWLTESSAELTARLSTAALPDARFSDLFDPGPNNSTATTIILSWVWLLRIIVAGWVASYFFTSGTLMYLLLRRINDQQDIREIWLPGLIPGTLAPIEAPEPGAADDDDAE